MFIFHWKRCVVGRELVGRKTCGSTLSSACSWSFIAYFAKSAAVAYGEVNCSSPLAAPTITKVKQIDKSLFIRELPICLTLVIVGAAKGDEQSTSPYATA